MNTPTSESGNVPSNPRDDEILATKAIRAELDATLQKAKAMAPSREISLAITKIQEGIMWAGMNLKRLNDGQTCYPNSYLQNTVIDPMKDGIKL